MDLPPAAEDHGALLDVMRLTANEMLDTIGFGIPAEYGLVLGPSGPHSWIGATILAVFRLTVAVSLFFVLYLAIRAGQTYARLTRQVLQGILRRSRRHWPPSDGRRADAWPKALRLRAKRVTPSSLGPRICCSRPCMRSTPESGVCPEGSGGSNALGRRSRVEALKYVCTYGDRRTALDLLGRFCQSGDPDLREGVSLICVAFDHPDCDQLLDEMGRTPQTAGEYRNAVIGAGVRLANERAERAGVAACLEALPGLLRAPWRRGNRRGCPTATFACQSGQEIQAAWQDIPAPGCTAWRSS
jgi:hypothetical protein